MLLDKPLQGQEVLADDKLGRAPFARTVASVLQRVSGETGLVLSIEGAWGSGKTTTLSIVEELLRREHEETRPLIVHFNPWLVGDRDALLRQFLAKLASEVKLGDPSRDGKRVAKELKTYAKAFDVLKLIPGAEPWASIVKSVVDTMGDAVGDVAEYKAPDIEVRKQAVADRLGKFKRRIIVFVDDIDRLFPLEVFEMVRIIKAVGDLPNVGYVVAWDPKYVREALNSANVPVAGTYLDKIVQVRLPLPALSSSAKTRLINECIQALPQEAHKGYFHRAADRLSLVYYHGLRNLLEQPRDIMRVFAAVRSIEPALRGELVLSDIIGFCALMVMSQDVFDLLRTQPQVFVGEHLGDRLQLRKQASLVEEGGDLRKCAIDACRNPSAARELVRFLFPLVAEADGETPWPSRYRDGHLSNPARLAIALQLSAADTDVSLVRVRRYLLEPEARRGIERELTSESFQDFMEQLGDFIGLIESSDIQDVEALCLAVARLVDNPVGVEHERSRAGFLCISPEALALRAIEKIVSNTNPKAGERIAAALSTDGLCLSVAYYVLLRSYRTDEEEGRELVVVAPEDQRENLVSAFSQNVIRVAEAGALLDAARPSGILWALTVLSPNSCRRVFELEKIREPSLDGFALALLRSNYDSVKGQAYAIPEWLESYVSLEELKAHAEERIQDEMIDFPEKAAWLSVVTGSSRYGVDGTEQD